MTAWTIPSWTPPWPSDGQPSFLRISASSLSGDARWTCAEQVAKKARPQVSPQRDRSERITYPPYADVPIGMVHTAMYSILSRGVDVERGMAIAQSDTKGEIAEPTLAAVRAGITGYLDALEQLRSAGELPAGTIVREFTALDNVPSSVPPRVEWFGWGLMHTSRDSEIREYHLLTWSRAGERTRSAATIGVYARIAADAVCVEDGTAWWEPRVETAAQPRPGREVRIREIGLLDGSTHLLFQGSLDDARALFDASVPSALGVLAGGDYQPTTRCSSCSLRTACRGIPRMPGVLGVIGEPTWPRAFSPGDLSHGRHCTWQVHLSRTLGLPSVRGEASDAMRRGSDVHNYLELAHSRREECTAEDLPGQDLPMIAADLGWTFDRYLALRPYLLAHLQVCALHRYDSDQAFPETSLGAWDTDADVVISTRADLVIADGDIAVIRETKTVHDTDDSLSDEQLLYRYPQVALAVILMASGLDPLTGEWGSTAQPGRVELEFLAPDGATVRTFDANDPETVLLARMHVAEATDRLLYTEPTPNPGRWCDFCPVSTWCDAPREETTWEEDTAPADTATPGSRTALLALAETAASADDDDLPF